MDPDPVPAGGREHLVHGIDGAQACRSRGSDHRPDAAPGEQRIQHAQVHPARVVHLHRGALDAEHAAHAAVGVVRPGAIGDAVAGMQLTRDVEGLQVRDRSAGGQVAQVRGQAEHIGQLRHGLLLHPRGGRPAVQRVVVGVDQHRREVADDGRRMRRLEHLPGIGRVEERVVLAQPLGEDAEGSGELVIADLERGMALERPERGLPLVDRGYAAAQPALQVHLCTLAHASDKDPVGCTTALLEMITDEPTPLVSEFPCLSDARPLTACGQPACPSPCISMTGRATRPDLGEAGHALCRRPGEDGVSHRGLGGLSVSLRDPCYYAGIVRPRPRRAGQARRLVKRTPQVTWPAANHLPEV